MDVDAIGDLWTTRIAREYCGGRITTERCLQAAIYAEIRASMPELDVYVEPGMMYYEKGGPRFRPDIVLCRTKNIDLLGEIKFMPHWHPDYLGDWEKLITMGTEGRTKNHELKIVPETGEFSGTHHRITDATIYAFFVVGRYDADAVKPEPIKQVLRAKKFKRHCYLFYGRIKPELAPKFGYESVL